MPQAVLYDQWCENGLLLAMHPTWTVFPKDEQQSMPTQDHWENINKLNFNLATKYSSSIIAKNTQTFSDMIHITG